MILKTTDLELIQKRKCYLKNCKNRAEVVYNLKHYCQACNPFKKVILPRGYVSMNIFARRMK